MKLGMNESDSTHFKREAFSKEKLVCVRLSVVPVSLPIVLMNSGKIELCLSFTLENPT